MLSMKRNIPYYTLRLPRSPKSGLKYPIFCYFFVTNVLLLKKCYYIQYKVFEVKRSFLLGSVMKRGKLILRTVLSTVMATVGLAVPVSAQEDEPAIERDTVLLSPLYFVKNGTVITDENESQGLWNDLMKYKLWGTESVIFNKGNFRIAEPSGYTGTATGDIVFNTNNHTLGGPIVSGRDLIFAMGDATRDSLIGGSIYARNLIYQDGIKLLMLDMMEISALKVRLILTRRIKTLKRVTMSGR